MWIHQLNNWTNFTWDSNRLSGPLAEVRYRQGRLLGEMANLGFELQQEASLGVLTDDIVKSSAIEGEQLNTEEVRSSVAKHLGIEIAGLNAPSRHIDGIVEMMLDATQNYQQDLTEQRLFGWHAALFPTGYSGIQTITVGGWRKPEAGPMQVISGPIGRETIHFEAPEASLLQAEMTAFLDWCQNELTIDPVIKAGIAHFWFVTIHPFDDGNGRIGRAIADLMLARADNSDQRFYSLSSQIEHDRKDYYLQLEQQQRANSDLTDWLLWFVECLGRAVASAEHTLQHVKYKAKIWGMLQNFTINQRQQQVLSRMMEQQFVGHINTSKYAMLAKCSKDTALRDIQDLASHGVLVQNPGAGRSTSYRLINMTEVK